MIIRKYSGHIALVLFVAFVMSLSFSFSRCEDTFVTTHSVKSPDQSWYIVIGVDNKNHVYARAMTHRTNGSVDRCLLIIPLGVVDSKGDVNNLYDEITCTNTHAMLRRHRLRSSVDDIVILKPTW